MDRFELSSSPLRSRGRIRARENHGRPNARWRGHSGASARFGEFDKFEFALVISALASLSLPGEKL